MVSIRRATERDFPDILRIQREAFSEYLKVYEVSPWMKETLENVKLDAADKIILVAQEEGLVVGSVRFWTVAGVCVIRLLSVSLAHQGRGVGKALMREAEGMAPDAHKFYVCTMLRTPRNIGLFLSLGYRPESLLPNHYHKLDLICFAKYPHVEPPRQ
ncbi:MAG: GNAT family N-acetyltransferase [Nitrospirae bacterium]|nr:MAG: GNAT family N-acetyltransferase [Nitrospirota bacterium]